MEIIFTTSVFSWGHEVSQAFRVVPPELVPLLDEDGEPVFSDDGQQVQVPSQDWTPKQEAIDLDTVVVVDRSSQELINVFKISFAKEDLANFLAFYVEHLDADGRKLVRDAMDESSGIILPKLELPGKLELVKS